MQTEPAGQLICILLLLTNSQQTGTAKIFAYQLSEQLSEVYPERDITVEGWHETKSPDQLLKPGQALHVFLSSVAGVGEPPDNGRAFYNWIMNTTSKDDNAEESKMESTPDLTGLEYAVFGLGNHAGHAAYYNAIGKSLDKRLEELGASRVMEIGLGDDGDCIEDDFDNWLASFMKTLEESGSEEAVNEGVGEKEEELSGIDNQQKIKHSETDTTSHQSNVTINGETEAEPRVSCPGVALSQDGTRTTSKKYPMLKLATRVSDTVRKSLFHLQGTPEQFYAEETVKLDVISNKILGIDAGESGIHEMKVVLRDRTLQKEMKYETGDHLVIYPKNSQCIVDAFCDLLDVDRHAIIGGKGQPDSYPFPKVRIIAIDALCFHCVVHYAYLMEVFSLVSVSHFYLCQGLTIYETLSHCVDLGASPSPSFARKILGKNNVDYKNEIAYPRRTMLDLLLQNNRRISLEDLLFQCTPMRPRYYSIASSNTKHPNEIRLVYRPVKYVTKLGMLREGVCTSYLSNKGFLGTSDFAHVAAYVNSNPTFRLPKDSSIPVLFIAGGCGVAPIRGLLEERISLAKAGIRLGPGALYLGFRSKEDEVYREMIEYSINLGALTDAYITHSFGSGKNKVVTDVVKENGKFIWNHCESGGVTYLCGGARSFGAAIESSFLDIIQEHGNMDFSGSEQYLRSLIKNGKLMDDLAD